VWTDIFKLILQPRSVDHLWYLLALFNVSLIYLFFIKLQVREWIHFIFSLFLYLISKTHYFEGNSFFSDAFYFYIYLYIGALVSRYFLADVSGERILAPRNILFLLPFFIAGQYYWFQHKFLDLQYAIPFLVINLVACYFIFLISSIISRWNGSAWLANLGKHSLYIYVMHVFISSIIRNILLKIYPEIDSIICLLICFPLCLMIPVILYKLVMKKGLFWIFTFENPHNKNTLSKA